MNRVSTKQIDWSLVVRRGDHIVCSHMTSEPVALLHSLADSGVHDGCFQVFLGVPFSSAGTYFSRNTGFKVFGGMGSAGALARTHKTLVSMQHYSQCQQAFVSGAERADVVLVELARSTDGNLYLGAAHGYVLEAARRARCIVAEVNAAAPAVCGAPWPGDLDIDVMVETDYPLAQPAAMGISEVERRIAGHVSPLVLPGACLQVGIGSLPSAVLEGLNAHRHLGLHSGMLTPALWRLIERGVIDNSSKAIDAGVSVTGCVYGEASLYAAVHSNTAFSLRPPSYTHAAATIAQLSRFTAINSALEVDLMGQMNAEAVLTSGGALRQVGGVGGLNDFVRAARHAAQGLAVVALPSRQVTRDATTGAPRIVAALSGPATIAASDADVIVTEYGVAHLRNATLDERARALIAIAHPDDRDALFAAARRSGQIS